MARRELKMRRTQLPADRLSAERAPGAPRGGDDQPVRLERRVGLLDRRIAQFAGLKPMALHSAVRPVPGPPSNAARPRSRSGGAARSRLSTCPAIASFQ